MSSRKSQTFDPKAFLAQTGLGRTMLQYPKNKVIFAQGEPGDAVFYIQAGQARLTVLSTKGKEATIALLREGDFMGEGCIASNQPIRVASATAITDCCVLRIEREAMLDALHP
jgi:CRP-like cAMP-binding protein